MLDGLKGCTHILSKLNCNFGAVALIFYYNNSMYCKSICINQETLAYPATHNQSNIKLIYGNRCGYPIRCRVSVCISIFSISLTDTGLCLCLEAQ